MKNNNSCLWFPCTRPTTNPDESLSRILPSASWTCSGRWIHPDELLRTCLPLLVWREIISPAIKLSFPVTLCLHFYERLPANARPSVAHSWISTVGIFTMSHCLIFLSFFLLTSLFFPPPTAWQIFLPLKNPKTNPVKVHCKACRAHTAQACCAVQDPICRVIPRTEVSNVKPPSQSYVKLQL